MAVAWGSGYNCSVTTTLGAELQRWRGLRRLSQLELAARAGTTQRHLSFVESGRSRPGRPMVLRLAESLGLKLRERNALLLTAGYAPVYPETRLDGPALRPVRDALHRIIEGHMPYPAVIVGPYGDMVAANRAMAVMTEDAAPHLLKPPISLPRLALHPDGMAPRVANLAAWGRHITDALRLRASQAPEPDARLSALIEELDAYVPSEPPGPEHLGFAVPLRLAFRGRELRLLTTLTSFATALDVTLAELRLEAFLPADEETAEVLRAAAGGL